MSAPLKLLTCLLAATASCFAQTFTVRGTVTTTTGPVRYASVAFVNQSDTSKRYSALTDTAGNYRIDIVTSVEPRRNVPSSFKLDQNYPNPFSSTTTIPYQLNRQSDVTVTIYDILGREVKRFTGGSQSAGIHGVVWNGENSFGEKVAAGAYLYKLETKGERQVKKMVLMGGNVPVQLSPMKTYSRVKKEREQVKEIGTGAICTYRCYVDNTDETYPKISPKELDGIHITSDTSFDIVVYAQWYGQAIFDMFFEVLKPDGTVWTWGNNLSGGLGNGTNENRDVPGKVLNLTDIVAIDQSGGAAVAVEKNGDVWFWGNCEFYLGPPGIDTNVTVPITIAHLDGVRSITMNLVEIYLLNDDGTVWYMKLDWYTPVVVEGPRELTGISHVSSIQKTLALTNDGKIYHMFSFETLQDSLKDVIAISGAQERHVIALKKDGTVWGWGANDLGQLGDGTYVDSDIPVQGKGLTGVAAISANYDFNLALKKDGTVWFWGFTGKQGDTLSSLNTATQIQGLNDALLIYASAYCIALKADGTYWTFSVDKRIPTKVLFN